jgi:hypothetical protein
VSLVCIVVYSTGLKLTNLGNELEEKHIVTSHSALIIQTQSNWVLFFTNPERVTTLQVSRALLKRNPGCESTLCEILSQGLRV